MAECLALATTPEEVRVVFAEARARERETALRAERAESVAAQGANHSGVMVAFFLPREAARRLALPGGVVPSDLHITLAFLGDKGDYSAGDLDRLKRAVGTFAQDGGFLPLGGSVSGVGRFNPGPHSEGQAPIYASVNVPELQELRAALVESLGDVADVDTTFAYTPHITLTYVDADAPTPISEVPDIRFTLDTITLAFGDDRYDYRLGDEQGLIHPSADANAVGALVRDAAADLVVRELQDLRAQVFAGLTY